MEKHVNVKSYDFWGIEANTNTTEKGDALLYRVNIDRNTEFNSLEEIGEDIASFKEAEKILEDHVKSNIISKNILKQDIDTSSPGWSSKYVRDWKRRFQIQKPH